MKTTIQESVHKVLQQQSVRLYLKTRTIDALTAVNESQQLQSFVGTKKNIS